MHVLVATDGSMDPAVSARFAHQLAGDDGETTVATIVRIPRRLVQELRAQYGEASAVRTDSDAEYVGSVNVDTSTPKSWPGDDAIVEQYLGNKRIECAQPIAEAIRTLGSTATAIVKEGDDIADDIDALATDVGADVILIGSHGHGTFQGLLGSTGAKLVRRSKFPVLVVR